MLLCYLMTFLLGISTVFARRDADGNFEDPQWSPPDGRDAADWTSCHGLSNREYDETTQLLKEYVREELGQEESIITENKIGDILFNREMIEHLMQSSKMEKARRQKRKILPFSRYTSSKWPLPIRYQFNGQHSANDQDNIKLAIAHWEANTCIRFIEIPTGTVASGDYLQFTYLSDGCYSYVGKIGGAQQINIGPGCTSLGTVAHEIGHALGFWHEQSRPDRDSFVTIIEGNVRTNLLSQFSKRLASDSEDLGVRYDYQSVMHYGSGFFANCFQCNTIVTVDPNYQKSIGLRGGLVFADSKLANLAYCSSVCTSLSCLHGGYADPNACSQCSCPPGFFGIICESVTSSTAAAGQTCEGGLKTATTSDQTIMSPGYDSPQSYLPSAKCYWYIKASTSGAKIIIRFSESFGVGTTSSSGPCLNDYVEVRYADSLSYGGARFCGSTLPSPITSEGSEVMIIFNGLSSARGFKLMFMEDAVPTTAGTTVAATTSTLEPTSSAQTTVSTPTSTKISTPAATTASTSAPTTASTSAPTTSITSAPTTSSKSAPITSTTSAPTTTSTSAATTTTSTSAATTTSTSAATTTSTSAPTSSSTSAPTTSTISAATTTSTSAATTTTSTSAATTTSTSASTTSTTTSTVITTPVIAGCGGLGAAAGTWTARCSTRPRCSSNAFRARNPATNTIECRVPSSWNAWINTSQCNRKCGGDTCGRRIRIAYCTDTTGLCSLINRRGRRVVFRREIQPCGSSALCPRRCRGWFFWRRCRRRSQCCSGFTSNGSTCVASAFG